MGHIARLGPGRIFLAHEAQLVAHALQKARSAAPEGLNDRIKPALSVEPLATTPQWLPAESVRTCAKTMEGERMGIAEELNPTSHQLNGAEHHRVSGGPIISPTALAQAYGNRGRAQSSRSIKLCRLRPIVYSSRNFDISRAVAGCSTGGVYLRIVRSLSWRWVF